MNAHTDPTQFAPANVPLPPMTEWMCAAPIRISRSMLRTLNTTTRETIADDLNGIRWTVRKFFERSLIRGLKHREFVVLSAILARTLSYGKFVEEIPISQFINGVRDHSTGEIKLDEEGVPIFEGTGLDKNTIRSAVEDLCRKGLTTVLSIPSKGTKDTYAFSMVSLRTMYAATLETCPENGRNLRKAFGSSELIPMAIFRDAAHELEERCANLFPKGLAELKGVQAHNAEKLIGMQRDYLAASS